MRTLDDVIALCNSEFASLGEITHRKMFGGAGIYCDGVMFALADDGEVYFKVDSVNERQFEEAGSEPFTYPGPDGQPVPMRYFRTPIALGDSNLEILHWASLGIEAARAAASKKKPKKPKL
jgi:DNA transformation protein and related proteins